MEDLFYSYVSNTAAADCIQTFYVCVPSRYALSKESIQNFLEEKGWIKEVEKNNGVLIAPVINNGWNKCSLDLLKEIYDNHKNDFKAPKGESIPGRNGILWLWETMIYAVGYDDGATYLGNVCVKHSNFFAGVALINGGANDFKAGDLDTDHWFVSHPSNDYKMLNKDVALPLWFIKTKDGLDYFKNTIRPFKEEKVLFDDIETEIYFCEKNKAIQIRVSTEEIKADIIMNTFFNKILRWKNSPDGTLRLYEGKFDYYTSERFVHHSIHVDGLDYHYSVHLPQGMNKEQLREMPLVISMHGRGEPTWVFAEKNGWDTLCDENKEFIVAFIDSPYNIWTIERDYNAIDALIKDITINYNIDSTRVYLTGFSNGAIFTCQQGSTHPLLFAACSPWNGPGIKACKEGNIASYVYEEHFKDSSYELPFFIFVGDNDGKADFYREDELEIVNMVNKCVEAEELLDDGNFYTKDKGYLEGERFKTRIFKNEKGVIMNALTIMKNMPHGAICDESRAAWEFMKKYRRVNNKIEVK